MTISKGDFVCVNFTKFGHNVVNAICEVKNVNKNPFTDGNIILIDVTKEQGNAAPNLGEWSFPLPSEYVKLHYPEVVDGQMVKITGFMENYSPEYGSPDQRGLIAKILRHTTTAAEVVKYRLTRDGSGFWYKREAFNTNLEAIVEFLPGEIAPPVAPKPAVKAIKYKCINPRAAEGVSSDLL